VIDRFTVPAPAHRLATSCDNNDPRPITGNLVQKAVLFDEKNIVNPSTGDRGDFCGTRLRTGWHHFLPWET
jgi:hypothetical protein